MRDALFMEAASLLCPEVLARFRSREAPRLRPTPLQTVDDFLARSPEMPREVAEYYVLQQTRLRMPTLSDFFVGIESEEQLDALTDQELYARHLEATDPSARARRQIDALRPRYPEHDTQLRDMRDQQGLSWDFEVLGSLQARGRVFVLFAWPHPEEIALLYEPKPDVAVVRETADGWRLAEDPSPYSGGGIFMGPIRVTGPDGETIFLDPNTPGADSASD